MTYDIVRSKTATKRALMIVPGVSGHSQERYIMELADEAHQNGFNVMIVNPIAPPQGFGEEKDWEVCDFSQNIYLT